MYRFRGSSFLLLLSLVAALTLGTQVAGRSAPVAATSRTVMLTAADAKGVPVTDLTAADLVVKEAGKVREIEKVEVASGPMQIAVIVDDNGTGMFRAGLVSFLNKVLGHSEVSISQVVGQVMRIVDYTSDKTEWETAIGKLGARPGSPDGGQLLSGVFEASKELEKRKAARPVIVALTVGGEEHSTMQPDQVLDALRKSGAALYVVQVAGSSIRESAAPDISTQLEGNMSIAEVLGDGPKQSGGRRAEITASAGLVTSLAQFGDDLMHQYQITYTLPDGVKPDRRIEVTTKRKGVVLHAPTKGRD